MSRFDEFDGDDGPPGRREPTLGHGPGSGRGGFGEEEQEAYAEAPIPAGRDARAVRRGYYVDSESEYGESAQGGYGRSGLGRGMRSPLHGRRLVVLAAGAALVVALVATVRAILPEPAGDGHVPLIMADTAPAKIRPEQPGGMSVPHQDKLVFERLNPGGTEPVVERLLPPPEEPLPRPVPPPAPVQAQVASEPPAAPAPPVARPEAVEAVPVPVAEPAPAQTPAEIATVPPPAPTPASPAPVAASVPSAGQPAVRLQIASVRSEDVARQEFQRLQRRFPAELGGLGLTVVRADLGDKGIYFRVHAGPVEEARADTICRTLKAQSVGCLVIR